MRAGFENFPVGENRKGRRGRESEEKGLREKASLFSEPSQRVRIVCFEMGAPYFKIRWGTRPRAGGPWGRLVL